MGSFKLRLVIYFMLLALLPLVAATVAFTEVAIDGEVSAADSRLSTAIAVAAADYAEQLEDDAVDDAESLARATQVQRAFAERDRRTLLETAEQVPHSAFFSPKGELLAGQRPGLYAGMREVKVLAAKGRVLGRIVVHLPFSDELAQGLAENAALREGDQFAFVSGGKVIAPGYLRGRADVPTRPKYLTVDGDSYRAVGTELLQGERGRPTVSLIALTPKAQIDAAAGNLRSRFLLFAVAAMAAVGIVAYTLGRTIVRSLRELSAAAGAMARGKFEQRVPVRGRDEFAALGMAFDDMATQLEARIRELANERGRVRDAIGRFGDALAATHDPFALLRVIVESAVEATGAKGARGRHSRVGRSAH
jgi:HAMP domain-containing protein